MEVVNQEEFTTRVNEIGRNINRIFEEMYEDEKIQARIYETKRDQIRRLRGYYIEQIEMGVCFDKNGNKIESTHHVSRLILQRMDDMHFSEFSKREVHKTLSDDCKRAWRQPITINGKQAIAALDMDPELQTFYNENNEFINELFNFDYNELPRPLKVLFAEKIYDLYKHHDKEWTKHNLQVVKHPQDDFSNLDPFSDIIRIEEGQPYEGMALEGLNNHIKLCKEIAKKLKVSILDKKGKRRISLEDEMTIHNGWAALDGYLKPWANYKWKRDLYGWSKIVLTRLVLKSKSGAAKFSKKKVTIEDMDIDTYRGITREEIDKNQQRCIKAFGQFVEHFPPLIAIHQSYAWLTEPIRAEHSVKLHEKLSNRA